jgi:BirA family transcriptional regulator, biotin operon repressor / biotin---[acetyl-CoA-carboxylase] ligase
MAALPPMTRDPVAAFVTGLLRHGRAPLAECPLPSEAAHLLGLVEVDGDLVLPPGWDPLEAPAIRAALGAAARRWIRRLDVYPVIGSTNVELAERATRESIAGQLCMAEVQLAGRGRRGRSWLSPLGGNLAVSLGFVASRPPAELGGFSLVVGLAVIDALEGCGIEGLQLKWPNDILMGGAKLGGILIELVQTPAGGGLIVGVGINVRLPESARQSLDQPVADLASAHVALPRRSVLAARLVSSIVDFEVGFAEGGFAPFVPIFDARHAYHDAEVALIQGARVSAARVLGVAADGGLRILDESGERVVHGGEVSLRPHMVAAE